MAIAFVAAASGNSGASSALTVTCVMPAGASAGDTAVVWACAERGLVPVITGVTGWTDVLNVADGTQMAIYVGKKVVQAGDSGTTITGTVSSGRRMAIGVEVWSGADFASIVAALSSATTSTANGAGTNTVTPPNVIPSADDAVIAAIIGWVKQSSPWLFSTSPTAGNGGTERVEDQATSASSANAGVYGANKTIVGGSGVSQSAPTLVGDTNVRYFAVTFAIPPTTVTPVQSDVDLRWAVTSDVPLPIMEGQFPARRDRVRRPLRSRLKLITPPLVVTPITSDLDLSWKVTNAVTSDSDLRWKVTNAVTSSSDLRWRTSNVVTSDVDLRWPVKNIAASDLDLRWPVRNIVTSDSNIQWAIRAVVTSDADLRYRVSGPVTSDADLRWKVAGPVVADLDLRWPVRTIVGVDTEIPWRVSVRTTSDSDLRWSVSSALILVQSDSDLRWAVNTTMVSELDVRWPIRGAMLSELSVPWAVLAPMSSDLDTRWAVLQGVLSDLDARWRLSGTTLSDLELLWALQPLPPPGPPAPARGYSRHYPQVVITSREA